MEKQNDPIPCDSVVDKDCSYDQWVSGSIPPVARKLNYI